jgi:hypothetical protein
MKRENRLHEYATAFAPDLTDTTTAAPDDVIAAPGKGGIKRYNVYRSYVTVSTH